MLECRALTKTCSNFVASILVSKWAGQWDAGYCRNFLDSPEYELEILTEEGPKPAMTRA